MKKITLTVLIFAFIFVSCTSKEEMRKVESLNSELNSELQVTLATQDSLFQLINEITEGMAQIKELEQIISTPSGIQETPSKKRQIENDMIAIQNALQNRRERLSELEAKLKQMQSQLNKSNSENATLIKTIENFKIQIEQQELEISNLKESLQIADEHIASLDSQVVNLNTTVTEITQQKEMAQNEVTKLNDELNLCFYAIGNKKELQDNNIMRGGFLRKTKILPEDFDKNYFTKADKRTLKSIPLHSKKAQVMTNHPEGSYQIVENNGQKIINIVNVEKFWELTNFLVVKID